MNPMMLVQMMMKQNPNMNANPMFSNAIRMAQSNDVQGLEKLAQNLAKEKGVNLNDIKSQVMQRLGAK